MHFGLLGLVLPGHVNAPQTQTRIKLTRQALSQGSSFADVKNKRIKIFRQG